MRDRANGGTPGPRGDEAGQVLPGDDWPARDEALAAVLREAVPEPPVDRVDWRALRSAVLARAELPLARLRRRQRWWEVTAGWARAAVPAAAAAGVVLALAVGALDRGWGERALSGGRAEVTQVASARGARQPVERTSARIPLEQALSAGTPQDAITNVLFETAGPDALIRAAVESR